MFKFLFGILFLYVVAVLAALKVNKNLKAQGLEGIEWTECFSPKKMFNVCFGFALSLLISERKLERMIHERYEIGYPSKFMSHVFEQYVIRFYGTECRKTCLKSNSGKCTNCGCDTMAKMWAPGEKCSLGLWSEIIWSKRTYAELREKFPVSIKCVRVSSMHGYNYEIKINL